MSYMSGNRAMPRNLVKIVRSHLMYFDPYNTKISKLDLAELLVSGPTSILLFTGRFPLVYVGLLWLLRRLKNTERQGNAVRSIEPCSRSEC